MQPMLDKMASIMANSSHLLHETVTTLSNSFNNKLLHPSYKKECYYRPFIPSAIRLYTTVMNYYTAVH